MFKKFLKWYKDQQSSSSTMSFAHTGTSFAGLTESSSLSPWVLDSGVTDHIIDNKSLFSTLSFHNPLPSITLVDDSRVSSHGVGIVDLFPSLTIDNVLYLPRSPFNLLSISRLTGSLDYVVSFTNNYVCLHDQSSKQVIVIEFCAVIMAVNIFLILLNNLLLFTVFYIKLLMLKHLNKLV